MAERITNLVLKEKIDNLKEYLVERNNLQDKRIELQEKEIKENTKAIAGMKGLAIGISSAITLGINAIWMFFKMKGGQS